MSCKLLLMQAHLEAGLTPQHGSTACKFLGCLKAEEATQQGSNADGQMESRELLFITAGMAC